MSYGPQNVKIYTMWPSTEKVCQPWSTGVYCHRARPPLNAGLFLSAQLPSTDLFPSQHHRHHDYSIVIILGTWRWGEGTRLLWSSTCSSKWTWLPTSRSNVFNIEKKEYQPKFINLAKYLSKGKANIKTFSVNKNRQNSFTEDLS